MSHLQYILQVIVDVKEEVGPDKEDLEFQVKIGVNSTLLFVILFLLLVLRMPLRCVLVSDACPYLTSMIISVE